jgi:hypothetical protein
MGRIYTVFIVAIFLLSAFNALGQVSVVSLPDTYTQDFSSFGTGNVSWTDNSTLSGWYATSNPLNANTGSTATNGCYNFGSGGNSDRAIGAIATTDSTHRFGLRMKNNAGTTITSFDIGFVGEQWRQNANAHTLVFEYQISSSAITSLTSGTWTAFTALDFTAPQTGTGAALDGNNSANRTTLSGILTVNVPDGYEIFFRWTKLGSNSPGLAVDDLSITASLSVNSALCATENFSNLPEDSPGNYNLRSWTGTDGVIWTAEGARTDRIMTGKAICFGQNTHGTRKVTSAVYAEGIGVLSFDYVRDFTGGGVRTLQIWVNGTQLGSNIAVSTASDEVQTYASAINITGNVQLEIRSTTDGQVKVDNISWTCACSGTPDISPSITSFTDVAAGSFTINFCRGNGLKRLVVVKEGSAVTGTPNNSTLYIVNPVFGSGDVIATGEHVVYYGTGNTVNVTGLDRNTTYHVAIFESCEEIYRTSDPATGSQSTTNALITVSVPDEMEYVFGSGPSTLQTFAVSGSNLVPAAGNIVISAPAYFQIATAIGGPYSNTLYLAYTGNVLSSTTIYVRLNAGLNVGLYTGSAEVSGGTAVIQPVAFDGKVIPGPCQDLFFSEYLEGTGNNKFLEIYNPSDASISLSNYRVRVYSNGSSIPTTTTTLSGTIAAYSTFVLANPDETWTDTHNQTSTNINFNGDDAVELYRVDINATIDIIGRIGEQPDDGGWFSSLHSTLNRTLLRKPSVKSGVRINPVSGFPTLESEWLVMDLDQFFFLGYHQSVCQYTNATWIENISPLPLCNGSEIVVDYATVGEFPPGNQFVLQLSSSSGNWSSTTNLTTFSASGTNPSGSINVNIPTATIPGVDYLLRLSVSNPSGTTRMTTQPMPVVFAPENVSSASVILFSSGQANVSWDNPTSCYDEIVVFINENTPVSITPYGNGSDYTVYTPEGCSTPENAVIYKGAASSLQGLALDNSITYHFKIFTRKGTSWSSGVSVTLASGQNVFDPGDLIILAINPADSCGLGGGVDIVYVMSFRDIVPGTTIDVTDNSWERVNVGKWGGTEGFYRIIYTGTTIARGTVFKLYFDGSFDITLTQALNPDWDITKYGTGSINFSVLGDQLFFLQGGSWENAVPSEHNATYTGGRAIYAFDSTPSWVSQAGSSGKSALPAYARCVEHQPFTATTPRFLAYTGITTFADRTTWLDRLRNPSNWTGYATCAAITSYLSGFPSSLSIAADASSAIQWIGTHSTNWFDCMNWQSRVIPTASLNTTIPNTTNKPRIASSAAYADLYDGRAYTRNLTIQNGGRVDMNGSANNYLDIRGNLSINTGGQMNMNDGNAATPDGSLVLFGNWDNNAGTSGFDEGQSKVVFKGDNTQMLSINAPLTEAFHQLLIQKDVQTAVVLSRPVSIAATGQMEFKCGGYLNANGHTVTLFNPDPDNALIGYEPPNESGVYENDRYIFGELIRQVDREAEYVFPVGDALDGERYNPVNLNITSADPGSGQVSGRFIPGNPGTISDFHVFYCSYSSTRKFYEYAGMTSEGWWRFSGPDYGYDITLYPNIVNVNTFPNDSLLQYRDNYRAIKAATGTGGGTWPSSAARAGNLCVVGGYYAVPGAGYTGFSDFGIPGGNGNTTALPIELILFRAMAIDNHKVMTEWVTASERNNGFFTIERSKNAIHFEAVGVVAGAGNSNEVLFYEYEDTSPNTGVSYYRLKQTDLDGNSSYSRIEQVFIAPAGTISVYPNPAKDYLTVELPESVHPYTLHLYDLMGRKVYGNSSSGVQQYKLLLEQIPSGMYLLKVSDGNTKTYFKMLRQ